MKTYFLFQFKNEVYKKKIKLTFFKFLINITTAENQSRIKCLEGNDADDYKTNYCKNGGKNNSYVF